MKSKSSKIMKLITVNRYLAKFLLYFLILFKSIDVFSVNDSLKYLSVKDKPLQVSVNIDINNIYNINTVNQTYMVDGYLRFRWHDEDMKFTPDSNLTDPQIYINDRVKILNTKKIWFPNFEFINVHENRETQNVRVEVNSDGSIYYVERFFGTFSSKMDFRRFPFDKQNFDIVLEPWGYNIKKVMFINAQLSPKINDDNVGEIINKWVIDSMNTSTYAHVYKEDDDTRAYSRVRFEIKVQRMSGYFIWQLLLPLLIIIVASFVIFWIRDFGIQIGVSFSLILTVVAFNFHSASILPKLPYNTYIEFVIISGYIFIFLGIIASVINYRLNLNREIKKDKLLNLLRYIFPIVFFISMILLYLYFT